jgi:hypothetical protein
MEAPRITQRVGSESLLAARDARGVLRFLGRGDYSYRVLVCM